MSVTKKELSLSQLFVKLGHDLEEIRTRALLNLLSKLHSNLVTEEDLAKNEYLQKRLLEWFNFSTCPHIDDVLTLIHRFVQHPTTADMYLKFGAVAFFSKLQANIDSSYHEKIDAILLILEKVPSVIHEDDVCNFAPGSIGHVVNNASSDMPVYNDNKTSKFSHISDVITSKIEPTIFSQISDFLQAPMEHSTQEQGSCQCFRHFIFQWVDLTSTDKSVLNSLYESLISGDVSLITRICSILSDILFHDFPSEVFLQRPQILQSLIELLVVKDAANVSDSVIDVVVQASSTLIHFCDILISRIKSLTDSFFPLVSANTDQATSQQSTNTTFVFPHDDVHAKGDSLQKENLFSNDPQIVNSYRQIQVSPHSQPWVYKPFRLESSMDETEVLDWYGMHSMQWTVTDFCVILLESLVSVFQTWDISMFSNGLTLAGKASTLLRWSTDKVLLWQTNESHHLKLKQRILNVLSSLGHVTLSHHHSNISADVAYQLSRRQTFFAGLSHVVVQLTAGLVVLELTPSYFLDEFVPCLKIISHDVFLEHGFPSLCREAEFLLSSLSISDLDLPLNEQLNLVFSSLKCCCQFLLALKECEFSDKQQNKKMIELAETGLVASHQHLSYEFILGCYKMASSIFKLEGCETELERCINLILKIMTHSDNQFREAIYKIIWQDVTETFNISKLLNGCLNLDAVEFLFDTKILYQMLAHGFNDVDQRIQDMSKDVILNFLQSKLIVPAEKWHKLIEALIPILPLLQSYGENLTILGKCIMNMLSLDDLRSLKKAGAITDLEAIRVHLRFIFHKDSGIRKSGLSTFFKMLKSETNSSEKLPNLIIMSFQQLQDCFIVSHDWKMSPRSLVTISICKESDLKRAYSCFTTSVENEDFQSQLTAVSQISDLLCDPSLHQAFLSYGGFDKLFDVLQEGILQKNQFHSRTALLSNIIKCLYNLVILNSEVCEQLAYRTDLYFLLARYAINFASEGQEESKSRVVTIIFFLIFINISNLVSSWYESCNSSLLRGNQLNIPSAISSKLHVPYDSASDPCNLSPWITADLMGALSRDANMMERMNEQMRVVWSVAYCGGVKNVVEEDETVKCNFNSALKMTSEDRIILSASVPSILIANAVSEIHNADSHLAAKRPLMRLLGLLSIHSFDDHVVSCLMESDWMNAFEKFLMVGPSHQADCLLLLDVIQLLGIIVEQQNQARKQQCFNSSTNIDSLSSKFKTTLDWLTNRVLDRNGAILGFIMKSVFISQNEDSVTSLDEVSRSLIRQILKLTGLIISCQPYSISEENRTSQSSNAGDLLKVIMTQMNNTDSVQSYRLLSLVLILYNLQHITARPGWSGGSSLLCIQLSNILLEVIYTFMEGRKGNLTSFIGCRVTRNASLCLSHVANEMAQCGEQDWQRNWLYSKQLNTSIDDANVVPANETNDSTLPSSKILPDPSLDWLFSLIGYRDVEVCMSGLCIATTLASTQLGQIILRSHSSSSCLKNIWHLSLNVLLDDHECNMIRCQAASLLTNLTSKYAISDPSSNFSHGPRVQDEKNNVMLVGIPCVLYLLKHMGFYEKFSLMLENCQLERILEQIREEENVIPSDVRITNALYTEMVPDVRNPCFVDTTGGSSAQFIGERQKNSFSPSSSTPTLSLISSIVQFVSNLFEHSLEDVLSCFVQFNLVKKLLRVFNTFTAIIIHNNAMKSARSLKVRLILKNSMDLLKNILDLLCVIACSNELQLAELAADGLFVGQIYNSLESLTLFTEQNEWRMDAVRLCESSFSFLNVFFLSNPCRAYQTASNVFASNWKQFESVMTTILTDSNLFGSNLWFYSLHFVSLSAMEEAKLMNDQNSLKDDKIIERNSTLMYSNFFHSSDNNQAAAEDNVRLKFGKVLIDAVISVIPKSDSLSVKSSLCCALKSIFLISATFKDQALKAGILGSILEQLQKILSELNVDQLTYTDHAVLKKKIQPKLSEIKIFLETLQNFLFQSHEVKMASCETDFVNICSSLWRWCLLDVSLISSMLLLLACLTADCPSACVLFISTTKPTSSKQNTILFSNILKFLQQEISSPKKGSARLKKGFALLNNLLGCSECRSCLAKLSFLPDVANQMKTMSKKQKLEYNLDFHWLKLLVNLSFHQDGQLMIMKVDDILASLLEQNDASQYFHFQLLILRNLCFNSNKRAKLLSNDKVVNLMLNNLDSKSGDILSIAISALLVLLINSQKLKTQLKNNAVIRKKLQDLLENTSVQDTRSQFRYGWDVNQGIRDILKLLDL